MHMHDNEKHDHSGSYIRNYANYSIIMVGVIQSFVVASYIARLSAFFVLEGINERWIGTN